MREEIKNWFKLAKKDLNTAKHNFESKDYYAASFFAQQAVEKGLKALQLKKQKKITKTHDLVFLAEKLEIPKDLIEKCDKLNPIYVETRYPDSNGKFEDYSKEESQDDIKLAEEVLSWIKKKI